MDFRSFVGSTLLQIIIIYSHILAAVTVPQMTVKLVSSLPLMGSAREETQSMVLAIQQALDETQSTACGGTVQIEYQSLDDATATAGRWDHTQEVANAKAAVTDKNVVACVGTFNSGATKLSIPILNQADLVMISPANNYPGLTKPVQGNFNEPRIYYPTGQRNFTRIAHTDDIQGKVAANWAKSLGVKRVFVLNDREVYGQGVTNAFTENAKKIELTVLADRQIDPKAANYQTLMTQIKAEAPDSIYSGGIIQSNVGQLIKDMHQVRLTEDRVKFMGSDGLFEQAFLDTVGQDAEGVYATYRHLYRPFRRQIV